MKNLEEYLSLPWTSAIDTVKDGDDHYVRLTVSVIPDFAVYGDSISDVKGRWREAFASHLAGYLTVGKVIPEPMDVEQIVTEPAKITASVGLIGEEQKRPARVELIAS